MRPLYYECLPDMKCSLPNVDFVTRGGSDDDGDRDGGG